MKKKILVCAYFAKNIGDDLFLKVLFDRYPHVNWELLTANRNYLQIFKAYKNVKIIYSYRDIHIGKHHFNLFFLVYQFVRYIKKYDAVVNIGGSIFMQSPAWQMKLAERDYLTSKLKAEKNFILGANFGPFQDDNFVSQYHELFTKYDDVCFRDSYSYNLFKDLENIRVAPDVVFNFKDKQADHCEKTIGFSTIHLKGRTELKKYTEQYNQKIAQLTEGYIEAGYQVKLFSFCENEGDLEGIHKIKNEVDAKYMNQISVIHYTGDFDKFLHEFKSCERIIGTRFHSLILAILYNLPFYPLIYSKKTSNFLADLGFENQGHHIKDIENLTINHVIAIESFSQMKDEQVFLDANRQFEKLDEFIGRRSEANDQTEALVCN